MKIKKLKPKKTTQRHTNSITDINKNQTLTFLHPTKHTLTHSTHTHTDTDTDTYPHTQGIKKCTKT